MSKSGHNKFKRTFVNARGGSLTDARKGAGLDLGNEPLQTTIEEENGQQFIKILPTNSQQFTDPAYAKVFPPYRLITENPVNPPTPVPVPDDGLISPDLNMDVTEFLKILNDIGSNIAYFTDASNASIPFATREIVQDKTALDSVSSNIIRQMALLRAFFYDFGKKIAPPGVNPYHINDCGQLNRHHPHHHEKKEVCNEINMFPDIDYAKGPYNPHDLNTYMNCLETLSNQTTVRENVPTYEDFNLKVFQSLITKIKVSKFTESGVDDLGVTRPQTYYNPMQLIVEFLKIDTKLFNILYLLNLHNSFRSPITGVFYGKPRTKINDRGFPVLSDQVTSTDISSATTQMIDLVSCIIKLITFVDIDSFNTIIETYFSIFAVDAGIENAEGEQIIIDDNANDGSQENIPTFLYGHFLSFCDASRQAINEIIIDTFPNSPLYNPTKVANIAYNCTYGLLALSQMIEELVKSRCFATVMSMLFPSGVFHSAPMLEDTRDFGPRFQYERLNEEDMQSITRLAIDGIPIDMSKIVPPKSIPHYIPEDDPICINKAIFCTLITALCGISRYLWNSNTPCLRLCDLNDEGAFDPNIPWPAPDETTTTRNPEEEERGMRNFRRSVFDLNFAESADDEDDRINIMDLSYRGINNSNRGSAPEPSKDVRQISTKNVKFDSSINPSNRAVRSSTLRDIVNSESGSRGLREIVETPIPPEEDRPADPEDLFSIKGMVQYLQKHTFASVHTLGKDVPGDKIYTYLQVYITAFAAYEKANFNANVARTRSVSAPSYVSRDLYSRLTRGIKF